MFTGIISHLGTLESLTTTRDDGMRLTVKIDNYLDRLITGSSHAINGVCLTLLGDSLPLRFDLSPETLQKTALGSLQPNDIVNIEPGLKLGDPIDGHLVSGHVDGVGEIVSIKSGDESMILAIKFPAHLDKYIAIKGSICIDGTSLTVNEVCGNQLSVTIIPSTLRNTRMVQYRQGSPVNIEIDMIARYLEKLMNSDMDR